MSTVKVTRHRQVTIPAHLANTIGVREGDILEVQLENEKIVLRKSRQELPSFRIGKRLKDDEIEKLIEESISEIAG